MCSDTLLGGYKRAHQARRNKKNSKDKSLTQAVIQHVKMAINKGISIQDLLSLVSKINPESNPNPRPKGTKPKRKNPAGTQVAPPAPPQSPVRKVWTDQGRSRPYFEDPATGWWWWADASSEATEQRSVRQKTSSGPEAQPRPQLAKVVAVHQAEWNQPVRLISFQEFTSSIKRCESFLGNLVCIQDPDQITQLKDLMAAFSITKGITIILSGVAKYHLNTTLTRARLTRLHASPKIEDVAIMGLGHHPPWPLPAVKIEQTSVTKVERTSVQIFVPSHYRQIFIDEPHKEPVTNILAELCQWGPKAHQLVPVGQALCPLWMAFDRVAPRNPRTPKLYELSGAPRGWQSEELSELLQSQHWSQVEVISKKRRGKTFVWTFRAQSPDTTTPQGVWTYECEGEFKIIVNESVTKGPAPVAVAAVRAPKKAWHTQDEKAQERPRGRSRARTVADSRQAAASPPRSRSRGEESVTPELPTDVYDLDSAIKDGWTIQDQLGSGDCGWRAIADNLFYQKEGKSLSTADCVHEGNTLRYIAVQHIKKHKERYAACVTGNQSFEEFCNTALKPETWINGTLLQAISEKLGTCLVVWKRTPAGLQRYSVAPGWNKEGKPRINGSTPILVLVLANKRYTSARPPKGGEAPAHWARETAKVSDEILSGAARNAARCPSAPASSSKDVDVCRFCSPHQVPTSLFP
eukprot:Skav222761  [mRNA]  locus=scaffold600:216037:218336:- [translate_table: standard]